MNDDFEIREGITQGDVRRNIRDIIQIQYEISFETFLQTNFLADEVFFINHVDKHQKEAIAELEKKVNFHDISEGEAVTNDIADQWYNEKITRDHYWFYKEYQSFLSDRLEEITKSNQPQKTEPEPLDLSDTTATEKIIYLQKLGVIDFLRKNNHVSINGLATVLSAITGAKIETLQPMLNPIISKDAGQKNNPLNSKNTVSKVEKQLINIGFNLNETI